MLKMPDFPPDFTYKGEPLDTLYWRYSLRCRVEREEDKAYYWPQLRALNEVLQPIVSGWKDLRLLSDQALQRMIGKPGVDGSFRATLRNAPVGGLQSWTAERLEKVGSLWLADNDHLLHRFEHEGRDHFRFYEPKGRERVHFFLTALFGLRRRLKYDRSITYQSLPHDFWLRIGGYDHQYAMSRAHPINQALDFYVWQGAMPAPEADALARKIGRLAYAQHIWKAESGFRGSDYTDDEGYLRLRYWVGDGIEDAVDGRNRYGSRWIDLLEDSA
jgi:hypothetical protein